MTLTEFRALAERATPGLWRKRTNRHPTTDGRDWGWVSANTSENVGLPGVRVEWEGEQGGANAAWIAAASPTAVLALIDRLERAEKCLRTIADAPAWGAPDRWETTPGECRRFAAAYFNAPAGEGEG